MKRLIRWSIPLLILVIGLGLAYIMANSPARNFSRPSTSNVDPLANAPTVATIRPQFGNHSPQLQLYGRYQSGQTLALTSPFTAEIEAVLVKLGERVEAGQSLIQLASADLERQVTQLAARRLDLVARQGLQQKQHQADRQSLEVERNLLNIAERSVARLTNLAGRNLSSSAELEAAERTYQNQLLSVQQRQLAIARYENVQQQYQAQLDELDSQIEQARAQLADANLTAPFAGRISSLQVSVGSRANNGQNLLRLVDDEQSEWVAWAAAPALDQVSDLTNLTATLDSLSGPQTIRLSQYDPAAEGGSLQLFFTTDEPTEGWVLNRYYPLWLNLPAVATWAVPDTSLYGNESVYVVRDNRLERLAVTPVGERYQDGQLWRLVTGPLSAEDDLLTTRLKNVAQGLAVKVSL